MVIHDKDASEKQFQERFVNELKKFRWEAPEKLDGNKVSVTVQSLIDNWRNELNRLNSEELDHVPLTDSEFNQVMDKVRAISNSFEASKLLSMENGIGKIDGIYRDTNPKVTHSQVTLKIFNKPQVSGGSSSYQVAREVVTDHGNRFDIVLLINGLPLINIEQKRTDKTIKEAYGQFKRYYRDGEYQNNFMAFSQMMVVTSEIETKYFATPKSLDDFNPKFVFHWADKQNNIINYWKKIISDFLMIPMAHQMVGDYLVIESGKRPENERHMLMRPYQIHALQAIEGAALGKDEIGYPHGGFIWHTTGSGKTITSFKTALVLSTRLSYDKVVFMVDRKELDANTEESFKSYSEYESVEVAGTASTHQLRTKLLKGKSKIIVTTTYKISNLVKDLVESKDNSLSDKRIIFIVDEAQRTTMGKMMASIKDYFQKNGLFYGFTGTPLFDENNAKGLVHKIKDKQKSELINTTEKLFGPELHRYTIDEAIRDGNVLGFNVDYINTGEFKDYDELKDKLIHKLYGENATREEKREIYRLSDLKTEEKAKAESLFGYIDETHIPKVVTDIIEGWDNQSKQKQFNAILTVAHKDRVINYYQEFKKQLANSGKKINIAMTFSFGNENDPDNIVSYDIKEMMFKDYAEFTGVEFIPEDAKHGENEYFSDLIDRTKRGGSGRNPKNIDLVIVADQLLTGYDSKRLNTLYVDRKLELQGLIQAYSRTNRVFDSSKEFGTIINYKYPEITKSHVTEAIKLYGSGGNSSRIIVEDYSVAVGNLATSIYELKETLPNPTEWINLMNDEEKKELFISAFTVASKCLNSVTQYYCFKWDNQSFGLTEHKWKQYVGAFKNLTDSDDSSRDDVPVVDLYSTKLQGTEIIDSQHILNLIGEKTTVEGDNQTINDEVLRLINEEIEDLSNLGKDQQSKLLKRFVDKVLVPGEIPAGVRIDDEFNKWKKSLQYNEIVNLCDEWGFDADMVSESVEEYSLDNPDVIPFINEIYTTESYERAKMEFSSQLTYTMEASEMLPDWMKKIKKKYE